ncbi:MAG: preprotein translocase subunit SecG [Bacteroidetes bacterium 4572_117]|nr:MAG: preprotein translocase subunit SecG [Bacteroidetes bacterium 4572_117]
MFTLISVLTIIASVLMILIVLVQNSKGGGLVSNFSSSNQIMGVRKTADFLEKATWTLALSILVLSIAGSMLIPRSSDTEQESVMKDQIENASDAPLVPNIPAANSGTKKEE